MSRFVVALSLLLPTLVLAEEDPRFARLRAAAEPVGSFGVFLEKYVGQCPEPAGTCQAAAEAFRKQHQGKKLLLSLDEDSTPLFAPGGFDSASGELSVRVTPFFAAGSHALTHGAPKKADARGNPIVSVLNATGPTPADGDEQAFHRLFRLRSLRAQVIFTPVGVWSLPKKGGGKNQGVTARVEAIQVLNGRTGEPVALWLAKH